jgi:hypothetical protein
MHPNVSRNAGRSLNARDVIILGLDSVTYADVAEAVVGFRPSHGSKVVFTSAWTPLASTSVAWRSMLSGLYPGTLDFLPGARWPEPGGPWLPRELQVLGYRTTMFQDDPATNIYFKDEQVQVPTTQGWKSVVERFVWKAAFPLSVCGARWWVNLMGEPVLDLGQNGYDPDWYWREMLARMGREASKGPILWTSHSCYFHPPILLTLREAMQLPSWWKRTPRGFHSRGNPFSGEEARGQREVVSVRAISLRSAFRRWLADLDAQGILGSAWVFIVSDHGQRAKWTPRNERDHVLLTVFSPRTGLNPLQNTEVSLADIAPHDPISPWTPIRPL